MAGCKWLARHCARQLRTPVRLSLRPARQLPAHSNQNVRRAYATSVAAAELQFGQPLHETHPHLLSPGELTPGITAVEYAQRRSRLANKLPKGAVAVLAASEVKYRAPGIFHEYRQETNFYYLTGFNEPDALAVIANDGSGDNHIFHLYVREKDSKAELWEGARSGTQAAVDVFNADETGNIEKIADILPKIIAGATEVYSDIPALNGSRSSLHRYLYGPTVASEKLKKIVEHRRVSPLKPLLTEMRVCKSENEVVHMRLLGQSSGRAFTDSMRKTFETEKDLCSYLEYQFKANGCDGNAFVPVVAGGKHALSIHYTRNDDILRDGDLVLVDGGGEHGNYISDITRTWPVNGKFTDPQRDLYNAVLNVHRSCLALCRESSGLSLDKLHGVAENGLKDQLKQLGFDVSGDAMGILFPHHLGHYIGLDVHDCPSYSRGYDLKAGNCITIEPGIYVPDDERWPSHFRGIGIRIEDSVCVGDDHPIVLTPEAVKEVADIEALRP
ncbi:Intermediate cleaving peptidase 55 [Penicillium ucsense]|uniref:Xaa-Pro aminopeptidase n=1 Tax=Penicillium ucsense TaxID=2839758 RepID=A0A8J8WLK7_9EURO|nr:Intermediate cleaving peptidase 55 [Penicillium ucsense]KAF7738055.1 Intermediate cleaving peptidase 55 [Penicillium ucsense]